MEMSSLSKELVLLILQFCNEEGYRGTAHMLACESRLYFDMDYFEKMVLGGEWMEAEKYLSGFTKFDDNRYSTKIYFEMRKQHFLEALDSKDRLKALDILMKDLKVFGAYDEDLFKEMTQLLTLNDIRENESLSTYGDTMSARRIMMDELKQVVEANPVFQGILSFPTIKGQRLRRLINQSLNWQHINCLQPKPNPEIKTLFVDHICEPCEFPTAESAFEKVAESFHPTIESCDEKLATVESRTTSALPRPRTPVNTTQSTLSTTFSLTDSADLEGLNISECTGPNLNLEEGVTRNDVSSSQSQRSVLDLASDLPLKVIQTVNEESAPTSMDFHPFKQTTLLVGTENGCITMWEVKSGLKLLSRNFKVWNIGACSSMFKAAMLKDPLVSVKRIIWSPDGSLFGAAFTKHIVQLYSYHGGDGVQQQLEIDAHVGSVNDIAFSFPENLSYVITCGDDKTIKVWDVMSGVKKFTFEGHNAPVYSVHPHSIEGIHFIFSTSVDGEIRAWLYDNLGARVEYYAPGLGCTTMAYSDDKRLFSCGTNAGGESFLVEWNQAEGSLIRLYHGLGKNSSEVVQFHMSKNKYLAAGDEHVIKIWHMDNEELLTTIDAAEGLPAKPLIRFNKDGTLLAVTANGNSIKILGTDSERHDDVSVGTSEVITESLQKFTMDKYLTLTSSDTAISVTKEAYIDEVSDVRKMSNCYKDRLSTIYEKPEIKMYGAEQCLSLSLPSNVKTEKISSLIYNNAGYAILALLADGRHLLWKWPQQDRNSNVKETTKVLPRLSKKGSKMIVKHIKERTPESIFSCIALTKNDSYLLSASGGVISIFNLVTFKTLRTFIPSKPAATCLACHPQDNNIVAIGMEDFNIFIYDARKNKFKSKLRGHENRVTGLAFSETLNVLLSSGEDNQLFSWEIDNWKKQKSRCLQYPKGKMPSSLLGLATQIQIHPHHTNILVVNNVQLAIYDAKDLECLKQWIPGEYSTSLSYSSQGDVDSITDATFSCDGQRVYASFVDGSVCVFDASNLQLHSRISRNAYLSANISPDVYPVVIAAHPQYAAQFALGLTDGGVQVMEPVDPEDNWGIPYAADSGSIKSTSVRAAEDDSLIKEVHDLPDREWTNSRCIQSTLAKQAM